MCFVFEDARKGFIVGAKVVSAADRRFYSSRALVLPCLQILGSSWVRNADEIMTRESLPDEQLVSKRSPHAR